MNNPTPTPPPLAAAIDAAELPSAERRDDIRHFLSLPAGCWHSPEYAEEAIQELLAAADNAKAAHDAQAAEVAGLRAELAEQEVAKLRLMQENEAKGKRLYEALDALGGMYCQYTPGEFGHDFMSAGEEAQDVLGAEGLLDKDSNFTGMPTPAHA